MKKILHTLFFTIAFLPVIHGQPVTLWGTNCNNETQYGNLGNVFKINSDGASYQNIHDFNAGNIGGNPFSNVIEGSDGWLYSSSIYGGLFKYNPLTDEYITTLASGSDAPTAYNHRGDLVEFNGEIWGISDQGGTYGAGAIYSWNISTGVYHEYPAFADVTIDGGAPMGGFVVGPNNLLYATTSTGGANGAGVIFSFNPVNHVYTKLYDINGTSNGLTPQGALLSNGDGALYGTTTLGGANSGGVLFRFTPATSQFEELHAFASIDGNNNSLSFGKLAFLNGNLFGTCLEGGANGFGVIYSFELSTGTYTKRFDFPAGYSCSYGLTTTTNSVLLGSIFFGGPDNGGLLYAFDSSNDTFTTLTSFVGSDVGANTGVLGYYPIGEPLLASNGNIYIQTNYGAVGGGGALVHFDPTLSASISDFQYFDATNGNNPQGQLTYAGGKLFGLAEGGPNGSGIIYSIDPSTGAFATCYDFPDPVNGRVPVYKSPSTLTNASDGFLYGSASGGSNGTGVLFKFNPNTLQYTKIFDFPSDSAQGYWPNGGLFEYEPGKFIGTTYMGGNDNAGVIFTYDVSGGQYQKRFDFDGAEHGKYPLGGLVKALDGKFYGVARLGGAYYDPTSQIVRGGVLFSYNLANNEYETHHDFGLSVELNSGSNGIGLLINPVTYSLVLTNDGKLCSGSAAGGLNRGFFAYDPQTKQFISPFLVSPFLVNDTNYIDLAGEYYPASDGNLYAISKAFNDFSIPGSQLFRINPKDFSIKFFPTTITGAHFNNYYGNQLTEVSSHSIDAGMMTVRIPGHIETSCTGNINPVCFMKNWGNLTISNATIRYKLNNGNWNTTNWNGQLWMGHFAEISLPTINVSAGYNTLTVVCDAGDSNPFNDTVSITFRTIAPVGAIPPFAENFDSGNGISNNQVYNYDSRQTWEITNLASHSAPSSIMIDNFNYKAYDQYDEIDLPELNLTTTTNPQISFWHAYALNSSNNYYDTLQVLVSINCGESFDVVYEKSGNDLSTIQNSSTIGIYTPEASDWRRDTVDISYLSEAPSVIVRFRNITSYNNRLFLDDINIGTAPASISNIPATTISASLAPNPNEGSFLLNLTQTGNKTFTISIVDITGKTLKKWTRTGTEISEQVEMNELVPGIYSLVVSDGNAQKSLRFTVTH